MLHRKKAHSDAPELKVLTLKPINKGHMNFYECCDLMKKEYLKYIHTYKFFTIHYLLFTGFHPQFGYRGKCQSYSLEVIENIASIEAAKGHFEVAGNEGM